MRTVEDYWRDFEEFGFVKTEKVGRVDYMLPPSLGEGGFSVLGDPKRAMALISDVTLKKPLVVEESVDEKCFEFGEYYMGESSFYQKKMKHSDLPHGLIAHVNYPCFHGYKRVEANIRLVSVGLCYRERFFEDSPIALPEDFWQVSARTLKVKPIVFPKASHICHQIRQCTLTGELLKVYVQGKALESLAIFMDFIYNNKIEQSVRLDERDIKILKQVKQKLDNHYKNPPTIKELIKEYPINQQKLVTGFKETFNMTILGYTHHLRMAKAIDIIKEDNMTIANVAREVGYCGDGHFQRLFKKTYGITPSQMRRELSG